jgi:hypothetical protein
LCGLPQPADEEVRVLPGLAAFVPYRRDVKAGRLEFCLLLRDKGASHSRFRRVSDGLSRTRGQRIKEVVDAHDPFGTGKGLEQPYKPQVHDEGIDALFQIFGYHAHFAEGVNQDSPSGKLGVGEAAVNSREEVNIFDSQLAPNTRSISRGNAFVGCLEAVVGQRELFGRVATGC